MTQEQLRIGEVAKRTGVSVRTLRHYDEMGLVPVTERSASGYRLYGVTSLQRLEQVVWLRGLGLGLKDIASILERISGDYLEILETHLAQLDELIDVNQRLRSRLLELIDQVHCDGASDLNTVINAISCVQEFHKHYSDAQLEYLKQRAQQVGEAEIQKAQADWAQIVVKLRQLIAANADPLGVEAVAIARDWQRLIQAFTGGDAGVTRSLGRLYDENHDQIQQKWSDHVPTKEMFRFMAPALERVAANTPC